MNEFLFISAYQGDGQTVQPTKQSKHDQEGEDDQLINPYHTEKTTVTNLLSKDARSIIIKEVHT